MADSQDAAPIPVNEHVQPEKVVSREGDPVEIHPAHRPIGSVKDFFLQLVTITAGVLIALSLEGLVEWRHHRALVAEAHETIRRELGDNRKELVGEEASLATLKHNLDAGLQQTEDLMNKKPLTVSEVTFGVSLGELSEASWQTAEHAGAFAHMDYGDLQAYSGVYRLQGVYLEHQRRLITALAGVLPFTRYLGVDNPAPRDLEALREGIHALEADVDVAQQLGRQLKAAYDQTLAR